MVMKFNLNLAFSIFFGNPQVNIIVKINTNNELMRPQCIFFSPSEPRVLTRVALCKNGIQKLQAFRDHIWVSP
jgi:hypothetical protein